MSLCGARTALPRLFRSMTTTSASPPISTTIIRQISASQSTLLAPTTTTSASNPNSSSTVLITGGMGQLGRSLASTLNYLYGRQSVLLTDICKRPSDFNNAANYCYLNVLDRRSIEELIVNYNIDTLVHFSALLSAVGEQNVDMALQVNCQGVQNVLEIARAYKLKIFIPSTIGVFGDSTPRQQTADLTIQRPKTIYGVTKVFAELLGEYYHERYAVDFRSLRFPGIVSAAEPGGGTTDYAIKIFYDALLYGKHKCYLRPDTMLPMMYDTDCMAAVINYLMVPSNTLTLRTYNITGFSFTPQQIATEIQRVMPHFEMEYDICATRQRIADSWPDTLDDSNARRDWRWAPEYDLEKTVRVMFERVGAKLKLPLGAGLRLPSNSPNEIRSGDGDSSEKIAASM